MYQDNQILMEKDSIIYAECVRMTDNRKVKNKRQSIDTIGKV